MNYEKEFKKYATNHLGISGLTTHDVINHQIKSSMTPYVLEERPLHVTQIDVFSRLMMDKIIFVNGVVDNRMSSVLVAQLLFLSSLDKNDINLYIDSPGGSVKDGLSIVDVMDYIENDVSTLNTGMAASMGSILLGAGTKGKRGSLRFSKTMLHQSSGGASGNIQDARITLIEWEKTNKILFNLLSDFCGKPYDQILKDCERDKWLDANESLEYGIIDEIITTKKKLK